LTVRLRFLVRSACFRWLALYYDKYPKTGDGRISGVKNGGQLSD
jgi:hypothetical protein